MVVQLLPHEILLPYSVMVKVEQLWQEVAFDPVEYVPEGQVTQLFEQLRKDLVRQTVSIFLQKNLLKYIKIK